MEPYRFQQLQLGGRFHVLLPKLTPRQMKLLCLRLESIGFTLSGTERVRATRGHTSIFADSSGLCTSNDDMMDTIAPVVPRIMMCNKKLISLKALRDSYFHSEKRGNHLLVRLSPRLETESYWDELRAEGKCALTPDERVVYSALISLSDSPVPLLTDFPVKGCLVRRVGRRQYYESGVSPFVASSTLRGLESKSMRNSYLPRDSILRLKLTEPPRELVNGRLGELGDWCFLSAG